MAAQAESGAQVLFQGSALLAKGHRGGLRPSGQACAPMIATIATIAIGEWFKEAREWRVWGEQEKRATSLREKG
jgi:hypothetical protein